LGDLDPEGFVAHERSRLHELRMQTTLDRADAELALGGGESLIAELEAIVRQEPFQERPRRLLMLAFYRAGRQADALALYRDTHRLFAEELGLEPSRELRDLEQAILRHDTSLKPAPVEPSSAASAERTRRRRWLLGISAAAAVAAAAVAAAVAIPL